MFYCDPCAKEKKWPSGDHTPKSQGRCEICGKHAVCNDVPTACLPPEKKSHGKARS
jgi:hypothetical protein